MATIERKLDTKQVKKIRELGRRPYDRISQADLSRRYGVSKALISDVLNGRGAYQVKEPS